MLPPNNLILEMDVKLKWNIPVFFFFCLCPFVDNVGHSIVYNTADQLCSWSPTALRVSDYPWPSMILGQSIVMKSLQKDVSALYTLVL